MKITGIASPPVYSELVHVDDSQYRKAVKDAGIIPEWDRLRRRLFLSRRRVRSKLDASFH